MYIVNSSIYLYNHTAEGIVLVYACMLRLLGKYEEALIILQCVCVLFLTLQTNSFLVTATEPTYAVIMNGSVTGEPDGVNITEYNLGVVTNGTVCVPTVRDGHNIMFI